MRLYSICFWFYKLSVWHLPYGLRKNPQDFRFSIPCLDSYRSNAVSACRNSISVWWIFPLRAHFWELPSLSCPLQTFLAYKKCWCPISLQNFLLAALAYMDLAATHLPLIISFCCRRIWAFRCTFLLNALREMCPMNEIPVICIVCYLYIELDRF